LVSGRRERADLRSLVAGCLVEFSLDGFVELRLEQLQPHKPPACDSFVRHHRHDLVSEVRQARRSIVLAHRNTTPSVGLIR
jgi:hypothetical protein